MKKNEAALRFELEVALNSFAQLSVHYCRGVVHRPRIEGEHEATDDSAQCSDRRGDNDR